MSTGQKENEDPCPNLNTAEISFLLFTDSEMGVSLVIFSKEKPRPVVNIILEADFHLYFGITAT
jgi:hypothetical protein